MSKSDKLLFLLFIFVLSLFLAIGLFATAAGRRQELQQEDKELQQEDTRSSVRVIKLYDRGPVNGDSIWRITDDETGAVCYYTGHGLSCIQSREGDK